MFAHTLTGIVIIIGALTAFWCIIILAWIVDNKERQMPIYEYKCPVHGKMEIRLPVDHGVVECPKCGAVMQKVYLPMAVHYKGKGFTKGNGNDD